QRRRQNHRALRKRPVVIHEIDLESLRFSEHFLSHAGPLFGDLRSLLPAAIENLKRPRMEQRTGDCGKRLARSVEKVVALADHRESSPCRSEPLTMRALNRHLGKQPEEWPAKRQSELLTRIRECGKLNRQPAREKGATECRQRVCSLLRDGASLTADRIDDVELARDRPPGEHR